MVMTWISGCVAMDFEAFSGDGGPARSTDMASNIMADAGSEPEEADGASDVPEPNEDAGLLPALEPASPTMYRLTRMQYDPAIADVFGPTIERTIALEADTQIHGFANIGAGELTVSALAVEQYENAAREVAAQVVGDPELRMTVLGCDTPDEACLSEAIGRLGRLLWRRSLTAEEIEQHRALFVELKSLLRDEFQATEFVLSALLQSPHFLFRIERGEPVPGEPSRRRFTNYEMASRLSFLFWNRGPDDQLLTEAENGVLTTEEGLHMVVERLVDDERTRAASAHSSRVFAFGPLGQLREEPRCLPTDDRRVRRSDAR